MAKHVTWRRAVDGSWHAVDRPIRIPARDDRALPVLVKVPLSRDSGAPDGWAWTDANVGVENELWSVAAAKNWVEANLGDIDAMSAVDYDGDPDDVARHMAAVHARVAALYGAPSKGRRTSARKAPSDQVTATFTAAQAAVLLDVLSTILSGPDWVDVIGGQAKADALSRAREKLVAAMPDTR